MKELLESYTETVDKIFSSFGIENGYGEIDIRTDVKWTMDKENVRWESNEDMYSNDIRRGPYEFENYVLLYVDNGCGENYYQIFNSELRDDSLED